MSTAPASTPLLRRLHEAVAACEGGNDELLHGLIDDLIEQREQRLAEGVVKLAHRVHDAIHSIDLDSRIACLAGRDIPDARAHLDHVVRMTEEAAHRTLDLVDDSRKRVDSLGDIADSLEGAGCDASQEELKQVRTALRGHLTELAQAQEYQDLSGQLIRRVIHLVHDIELALAELLQTAGVDFTPACDPPPKRANPALPGPAAQNPSCQQDADALLADLGL